MSHATHNNSYETTQQSRSNHSTTALYAHTTTAHCSLITLKAVEDVVDLSTRQRLRALLQSPRQGHQQQPHLPQHTTAVTPQPLHHSRPDIGAMAANSTNEKGMGILPQGSSCSCG